jgi:uncharacterized membrane protein
MAHHRAFVSHDPRQARGRLLVAFVAGIATFLAIPAHFGVALRAVTGWDAAALTMGALGWWLIVRGDAEETRCRAAADDPGRRLVWLLVILASGFSLFATAIVLRGARAQVPEARQAFIGLCIVAVASAWMLTHTAYTLRYAHLYYRDDGDGEGGLVFPGDTPPDFLDFAYFAFTIGMCFQVSDVAIANRGIRRTVLGHSLLSFAYNTVILATAINLVAGAFAPAQSQGALGSTSSATSTKVPTAPHSGRVRLSAAPRVERSLSS